MASVKVVPVAHLVDAQLHRILQGRDRTLLAQDFVVDVVIGIHAGEGALGHEVEGLVDLAAYQPIREKFLRRIRELIGLRLVSLDYGGETREVGAIDVNIDQDLVA